MCHYLLDDASFWCLLVDIDRELAATIRSQGCPCGGTLHSARYPRKPRGWPREQLGVDYESRLSFCCNQEGCRRRYTPPSICMHNGPVNGSSIADRHLHRVTDQMSGHPVTQ